MLSFCAGTCFGILVSLFLNRQRYILKFFLKYLVFYGIFTFSSIYLIIRSVCSLKLRTLENALYYIPSGRAIGPLLGVHFECRGQENIPKDTPCILVSNHQSDLDVTGMATLHPWKWTCIVKRENLYLYGPFGLANWMSDYFLIDRFNHASARATMDKCIQRLKETNIKLWIFPEGQINVDATTFMPFKKGAFNMAVEGQFPIIPVVFSKYNHFLNIKERRFESGTVIMTCLPMISTEGLMSHDVCNLVENVRKQMLETYDRTNLETAQNNTCN